MIKNDGISATTVSFVSGRGGVGKTSISISLATFLSSLGKKKVLLIDFDLETHGASHFFKGEIEEKDKKEDKELKPVKGIEQLIEVLVKEDKIQQKREKIVKLVDELVSGKEDKIQQQREKIVKLLCEVVNHKIDENQQAEKLIIELLDKLIGSKQENENDKVQWQKEGIVELIDKLISGKEDKTQLIKALVESNLLIINPKKAKFDFIPSTSFSTENRVDYDSLLEYSSYIHPLIGSIIKIWGQKYDFILIDSRAGANLCSYSAIQSSRKVVFVVHPDPLCVGATYGLCETFKKILSNKDIFCIYNFIQKEEAETHLLIKLPHFRNLPPLPYDDEVYSSLKAGEIPFDENESTAFSLGIIRLANKFLDVRLEQYYKDKVEEKLKDIDSRLRAVWKILINMLTGSIIRSFIVILLALSGVYGASSFIFMRRFSNIYLVALSVGFTIFVCLFIAFGSFFKIKRDIIRELHKIRETPEEDIFYLKADQRKYEVLKTDRDF